MPSTTPVYGENTGLEVGERLSLDAPQAGATGFSPPNKPTPNQFVKWVNQEIDANKSQRDEFVNSAKDAFRFVAGDQYTAEDRRILRQHQRPDTAFNSVQKFVNHIGGVERRSPSALMFDPAVVENAAQQETGEFLTNCYEWAMRRCGGHQERSRAFEDMLTCGMGWTQVYLNKQRDPRGLIEYQRFSPFEAYWPDCADENLRTTRWRGRESLVDKDDAIRRFPDHRMQIEAAAAGNDQRTFPGGPPLIKYTVPYIETENIDNKGNAERVKKGKVSILEWQYFEDEDGYAFVDPGTKQYVWLDTDDFRKYERSLQVLAPNVRVLAEKASHRVYRVAYILNRQLLLGDPKRLPGDRFSINCITGRFDEDKRVWYGFVRLLQDPQRYANKFFNQMLEIIGTSAKGGMIAEETAFSDNAQRDEFKRTFSQPGSVNTVADGAISKQMIMPKPTPEIPPATFQMMQWCVQSMEQVTGITAMTIDSGGGQMPAQTLRQKQGATMVLLAHEYDALSRYRVDDEGRTIAAFLGLIADSRLIRVGGPLGSKTIPLLQDPFALEYDVILDDNEQDPNARQAYQQFIAQVAPMLARQGLFVPSMFNWLPFPAMVRREIIEAMQAQQKQSQEAAAAGINLHGRGTPKDPRETEAKIAKLVAQAQLEQARTQTTIADAKREDLATVLEHQDAMQRNALEASRQQLERQKAHAQTLVDLLEAIKRPSSGGGEQ